MSLLHVVQTGLTIWQCWEYRPGQAPKWGLDINFNLEAAR